MYLHYLYYCLTVFWVSKNVVNTIVKKQSRLVSVFDNQLQHTDLSQQKLIVYRIGGDTALCCTLLPNLENHYLDA